MKEFSIENQGANSYLVYEVDAEEKLDAISLGMLTGNRIRGLAATSFMQLDDRKFIRFNITAKITADQFFSRPVTKKSFLGVFSGIADALISAEDYMLDPRSLILDLNEIFTDVSTGESELICLPIEDRKSDRDPKQFLKETMFGAQFDPSEDGSYVTKILNYLNGNTAFSPMDFKGLLEDIKKEEKLQEKAERRQESALSGGTEASLFPESAGIGNGNGNGSGSSVSASYSSYHPASAAPLSASPAPSAEPEESTEESVDIPEDIPKEERISLFYLLQHYNGDRAKQYMAQQKQLKARKAALKQASQPASGKQKQKQKQKSFGFSVPGLGGGEQNKAAAPQKANGGAPKADFGFQVPGRAPTPAAESRNPAPQKETAPPPKAGAPIAQSSTLNFGETTVLGGGAGIGETTVLSHTERPDAPKSPFLIRLKNNERIPINKPVFRLGKEKSFVDYLISDNGAISRSHANIVGRNGSYYVVDNNSTNHTFLNGKMLESNVETALEDGSRIRLGNEDFEFKLL